MRRAIALSRGSFAQASAMSLGIQVAGVGLGFLNGLLAARLFGAAGYGVIAVAMSIVSIAATVSLFGFGPLAVREVPARIAAGDVQGLGQFLRQALVNVMLIAVTASVGIVLFAFATPSLAPVYRPIVAIGGFLVIPVAFLGLFRGVAQGFERVVLAQLPGDVFRPTLILAVMATVFAIGIDYGPAHYMWTAAVASTLTVFVAGVFLWNKELASLPLVRGPGGQTRFFVAALPFAGLGLTGLLEAELSTLLLATFTGPRDTGQFQPVIRLAPLMLLPVQAVLMLYAPRIAELWQRGEIRRIQSLTLKFTAVTTALTVGSGAAVVILGPYLMRLFGPEFSDSARLLWIVAGAQVVNAACGPVGWLLIMAGRSSSALVGQVIGLLVNVAVGAALIPAYGAWGAATSMAGGVVAWNITLLFLARRQYGFDPSIWGVLRRWKTSR